MADPIPQFSDLVKKLNNLNLAYLHMVESRVSGNADVEGYESLNPLYALYTSSPLLIAGGFEADSARKLVDEELKDRDVVVVFGRYFISTPDLVFRLEKGIDLNPYDRDTFYVPKSEKGYTDYSFSEEFKKVANL
jgi:NADPH2 dehydrogenase